jgi:hypothetical protein
MTDLAENNVVRFIKISRKKSGIFAEFKVKGERNGVLFAASISVDVNETELSLSEPLEQIIEASAKLAVREFKKSDLKFEGMAAI